MGHQSASADHRIARIAGVQHGIVTTAQLVEVGLTKSAIAKRARRGGIYRLHRGVYAVGHMGISEEARWMAAVLACGADAVLSHGAAAVHWGLLVLSTGRSTSRFQPKTAAPDGEESAFIAGGISRRLGQPLVHQVALSLCGTTSP
jgi:hypothetical protein